MKDSKIAQGFSQAERQEQTLPKIVVLHIPHSSRYVPAQERQAIRLNDAALDSELLRMTDAFTDELFPLTPVEAGRVVFPISRLVCDVERFPLDEDEPMASRGMGVIYTRTSLGEVLRPQLNAADRQSLMNRWYRPHHSKLKRMVNDVGARSGCQSAFKFAPRSASNFDPFVRRVLAVALAPSELARVAETARARVVV
jgi:N-formylglutamate amidohydrolase